MTVKVRAWYRTPVGWQSIDAIALNREVDRRTAKAALAELYERTDDPDILDELARAIGHVNVLAQVHVLRAPTLRDALTRARDLLPASPERDHIQRLLDQTSDEYGTLVDECEQAIYG